MVSSYNNLVRNLKDAGVWCSGGGLIRLEDMEDSHVVAAIRWCEIKRRAAEATIIDMDTCTSYLASEAERRGL